MQKKTIKGQIFIILIWPRCTDDIKVSFYLFTLCLSVYFQSVIARGRLVDISEHGNYVPVFINFSAQTSSNRTQEMIEGKLEKRRKNILGKLISIKEKA